ncbi:hypothetical protein GCM10009579_10260 [Streptomyces javensis]|uniref:Uncharacterized protein n=1 Tax=Streptomyces javensis TaxID=114698 RepID=A0ABN1WLI2_9ACTN
MITSAATLVEVVHPGINRPALEWTLSRVVVEPVTDAVAGHAAALLADTCLHGHKYAIDAMLSATALAPPGRTTVLTSDSEDICHGRATVGGSVRCGRSAGRLRTRSSHRHREVRLDHQLAAHQWLGMSPFAESPAGGTLNEVPADPATSPEAECGVFLYAHPDAVRRSPMTVIT